MSLRGCPPFDKLRVSGSEPFILSLTLTAHGEPVEPRDNLIQLWAMSYQSSANFVGAGLAPALSFITASYCRPYSLENSVRVILEASVNPMY